MFATLDFDKTGSNWQKTRFSDSNHSEDNSGLYRYLSEALWRNSKTFMTRHGGAMGETEEKSRRVKVSMESKEPHYVKLFERHHQKISK